ncbi:hypothetical protein [Bradyrhizobium yuanmingense]|uniref:hypothetical protein n=1 Tax=Bradyrhizobium yuanmingense TaxID=108015 RepID=UPI0035144F81
MAVWAFANTAVDHPGIGVDIAADKGEQQDDLDCLVAADRTGCDVQGTHVGNMGCREHSIAS